MLRSSVQTMLLRELAAVRRSIEAYPDDASVWRMVPGLPNAGGTLALHVAGNLQHYVGAVLGHTGYVRDRDAEFSRRDVPREQLLAEIDAATEAVERTLESLPDEAFDAVYPERVANRAFAACDWFVHLAAHLAYHLGQLDYHRRGVTGDRRPIDALPLRDLPDPERSR
jgi:DinB superfamily